MRSERGQSKRPTLDCYCLPIHSPGIPSLFSRGRCELSISLKHLELERTYHSISVYFSVRFPCRNGHAHILAGHCTRSTNRNLLLKSPIRNLLRKDYAGYTFTHGHNRCETWRERSRCAYSTEDEPVLFVPRLDLTSHTFFTCFTLRFPILFIIEEEVHIERVKWQIYGNAKAKAVTYVTDYSLGAAAFNQSLIRRWKDRRY
jgi:hypothetical protein